MLDDLSSPAGKGFEPFLKVFVLVPHFDGAVPFCLPCTGERQTTFFSLVRAGEFDDFGVEHFDVFSVFNDFKTHVSEDGGPEKTLSFDLPQFSGIELSIAADIEYNMTDGVPGVIVVGPENKIENMNFEVTDGLLRISREDDWKSYTGNVKVYAKSATLESLDIRGAGDFDAPDGLDCSSLDITISGAGDVDMNGIRCSGDMTVNVKGAGDIVLRDLSCENIDVTVLGAGDVTLKGSAQTARLVIKGAGDIDARDLKAADISSNVNGIGTVKK